MYLYNFMHVCKCICIYIRTHVCTLCMYTDTNVYIYCILYIHRVNSGAENTYVCIKRMCIGEIVLLRIWEESFDIIYKFLFIYVCKVNALFWIRKFWWILRQLLNSPIFFPATIFTLYSIYLCMYIHTYVCTHAYVYIISMK